MKLIKILKIDKILAINTSSLFLIYFLNFCISIIILPKLISNYGITNWGKITFSQLIINYYIWFIDWSFPQYACNLISINENNTIKRNNIFNKTINAQLLLFSLSALLLIICYFIFNLNKNIYLYSILILLGSFLQPYWYLNGRERIYESALFQLLNKLIFTYFIFSFIPKNDYISNYFLFFGLANILTGIICMTRIKIHYKEEFNFINHKQILSHLKESYLLFNSSILGNITTSTLPFLINYFYLPDKLGIYNIADRIKNLTIQIFNPLSHSIFPRMSKYYISDKPKGNRILIRIASISILLGIIIFILSNIFINDIIIYFSKNNTYEITRILRVLLISFLSNILYEIVVNQYLTINQYYKEINKAKLIIFVSSILFGIPLISTFGIFGAALTNLIYEITGLIYVLFIFLKTKNI